MLSFLFLLLLARNPIPLQAEHSTIFDRGAGTSFSSVSHPVGGKQVQMQVCITIGCCQHVCRQFSGESSVRSEQQQQERPELAPYAAVAPPQQEECQAVDLGEHWNSNGAVVPRTLEFGSQDLFAPAIKFLTILNTDNSSWIKIQQASSTDEQFFVQGLAGDSAVAPGESLAVAVVFLPGKLGVSTGRIIFRTTAGGLESQVSGRAVGNFHNLGSLEDIEAVRGELVERGLHIYNPDDEAIEVKEIRFWPGDYHKQAICSSSSDEGSVSSCFGDGLQSGILSETKIEKYVSEGVAVSLEKREDPWMVQPRQSADLAKLDMIVSDGDALKGHVYIRFSRFGGDSVLILPLGLRICSENGSCKRESSVAAPTSNRNPKQNEQVASGSWVQTNDLMALRMAEALLKDLAHTLLRQRDVKKGGLGANQNEATIIPGLALSFQTVQTGSKEQVWIDIVNPTEDPILVNLILSSEAKSRNCKFRANWFWQGHKAQVHKDTVFSFGSGAVNEAVVQGGGKMVFGPLTFQTRRKCEWTGLLFVKNNLTGLEWVPVRGKGGSAELVILDEGLAVKKLKFAVAAESGMNSNSSTAPGEEICKARFRRSFQMKNTGNIPLDIRGIDLADAPSVGVGFEDGFGSVVPAGKSIEVTVSYQHDYQQAGTTKQVIRVLTSIGAIQIPVAAAVDRDLVSICGRNPRLEEKVLLPVSVCALVLVLGIFSWLLLQEISPQTIETKQRVLEIIWKKVARIRTLRKVKLVAKNNVAGQGQCALKPVKLQQLAVDEKLQLKKKRKPKTSSPSSSGSASPHSSSDSEIKVPAIDRILSRFSERESSPRRSKTRISFSRKESMGIPDSPGRTAPKAVEVHAAWKGKLAVRIPPSDSLDSPPAKVKTSAKNRTGFLEARTKCETPPAAVEEKSSSPPPPPPSIESIPPETASSTPSSTLADQLQNLWKAEAANSTATPSGDSSSGAAAAGGSKQLTSIGQLRKAAIERTTEKLQLREALHRSESLYDIWGDHFGEISSAISTPTGSPNQFAAAAGGAAQQSLFSRSLPSSSAASLHSLNSYGYKEETMDQFDGGLSGSCWSPVGFCPTAEGYAAGLSEPPPPAFLEWNAESVYTTIVS